MDFSNLFAFLDDKASIGPKLERLARISFYVIFGIFCLIGVVGVFRALAILRYSFILFLGLLIGSVLSIALGYLFGYLGYLGAMALARIVTNTERIAVAAEKMAENIGEE